MLFDCMYECGGPIARHVDGPQWADGVHRNGMRVDSTTNSAQHDQFPSWQKKPICGKNSPKAGAVGLH